MQWGCQPGDDTEEPREEAELDGRKERKLLGQQVDSANHEPACCVSGTQPREGTMVWEVVGGWWPMKVSKLGLQLLRLAITGLFCWQTRAPTTSRIQREGRTATGLTAGDADRLTPHFQVPSLLWPLSSSRLPRHRNIRHLLQVVVGADECVCGPLPTSF
jgi:hypothetical protein